MNINITRDQYRDLLLSVIIGTYIREAVDEQEDKDISSVRDMEKYLFSLAKEFDSEDLVESIEGKFLIPSNAMSREYHDHYIEEFTDDHFWHELMTRLGQRDFAEHATKQEKQAVEENDGWMTGVIDKYYEKYEDEFEKHGIDRLGIVEK